MGGEWVEWVRACVCVCGCVCSEVNLKGVCFYSGPRVNQRSDSNLIKLYSTGSLSRRELVSESLVS